MNKIKSIRMVKLLKQLALQAVMAFTVIFLVHLSCKQLDLLRLTLQPFLITITIWTTGALFGKHHHNRVLTDEMFVCFFTTMTGSYITSAVIYFEALQCSFMLASFSVVGGLIGFYLPIVSHRLKLF